MRGIWSNYSHRVRDWTHLANHGTIAESAISLLNRFLERSMRRLALMALTTTTIACVEENAGSRLWPLPPGAQAVSLFGDTLAAPPLTDEVQMAHEQRLVTAQNNYAADSTAADAIIWLGRRTAYLGQYREAIEVYTKGIELHPKDPRMYRHRGHRYISVRRFDLAVDDLEHAANLILGTEDEIEPDGLPNARNIPTSTLQFNIWYHLGLTYYLTGRFADAVQAYRECMEVSKNPDALVATSYWLYMTLKRLGLDDDAAAALDPISLDMDIIENHTYHRLLLLFTGQLSPTALLNSDDQGEPLTNATVGYGVGNWYALTDRPEEADRVWRTVLSATQWSVFGYIAAEAEIARAHPPR